MERKTLGGKVSGYIRSNAVGFIALFVALGGGAYAHGKIGTQDLRNNAVTAKKIKKNAVTPQKIRRNAVRPVKIASDAVRPRHIIDGALTAPKISNGAVTGDKLGNTSVTASKLGPIHSRSSGIQVAAPADFSAAVASCEPGEVAISGGAAWTGQGGDMQIVDSRMFGPSGWRAQVFNSSQFDREFLVEVYCLEA